MNKKYIISQIGKGSHGTVNGSLPLTIDNLIEIPTEVGSSSGESAPAGPTKTSDLTNDGSGKGYQYMETDTCIPSQTSDLTNNGTGNGYPFITINDIPSSGGSSPYELCGSSITPNYNGHDVSCASASVVGGGYQNYIARTCNSTIGGGYQNCIIGNEYSDALIIAGGQANKICHDPSVTCSRTIFSSILGGCGNLLVGNGSIIGGGQGNSITQTTAMCSQTSNSNFIGGGFNNHLMGNSSIIVGGRDNTMGLTTCQGGPTASVITGGTGNFLGASYSSIVGEDNCIDSAHARTHILGSNICSNRGGATFVNKMSIMEVDLVANLNDLPVGAVYKDASGFLKIK